MAGTEITPSTGWPPGHGNGVVEQYLVGDIGAGGLGLANGHIPRVKIGPLSQVLKNMFVANKT